jgi:tRNA-dihydrouridine synthase A
VENATKQGISVEKSSKTLDRRISVAPMMDWTDRHCRYFLRGFAADTLLYTEMITAAAILRGDRQKLLRFDPEEHPVALQLGGSDPEALAQAARIGTEFGYDEINLNCGCPSDRVHSGAFGACLMLKPRLVAECVAAMRAAVRIPVTVKLRIGVVDASELGEGASRRETARAAAARFGDAERAALEQFVDGIVAAGCDAVIVHARKAVLGAWSPADNREIPPLRYDVVRALQARVTPVPTILNGGLRTAAQVVSELRWADGAMLGREAYHRPMLLAELSGQRGGELPTRLELLERMAAYASREVARGERLSWIARHMLGLYAGMPGAKEFRRRLSEGARDPAAGADLLLQAGEASERLNVAALSA